MTISSHGRVAVLQAIVVGEKHSNNNCVFVRQTLMDSKAALCQVLDLYFS